MIKVKKKDFKKKGKRMIDVAKEMLIQSENLSDAKIKGIYLDIHSRIAIVLKSEYKTYLIVCYLVDDPVDYLSDEEDRALAENSLFELINDGVFEDSKIELAVFGFAQKPGGTQALLRMHWMRTVLNDHPIKCS